MKILTILLIFLVLISPLKSYSTVEDVEPADPGEAGHETILGIDSDKDGVRDDVEIFINQKIPKTSLNERLGTKLFAYILQKEFENNDNKPKLKILDEAKQDAMKCLNLSLYGKVFGQMNNTKDRIRMMAKINGLNHGKEIFPDKKCRTFEQIKESIKGI